MAANAEFTEHRFEPSYLPCPSTFLARLNCVLQVKNTESNKAWWIALNTLGACHDEMDFETTCLESSLIGMISGGMGYRHQLSSFHKVGMYGYYDYSNRENKAFTLKAKQINGERAYGRNEKYQYAQHVINGGVEWFFGASHITVNAYKYFKSTTKWFKHQSKKTESVLYSAFFPELGGDIKYIRRLSRETVVNGFSGKVSTNIGLGGYLEKILLTDRKSSIKQAKNCYLYGFLGEVSRETQNQNGMILELFLRYTYGNALQHQLSIGLSLKAASSSSKYNEKLPCRVVNRQLKPYYLGIHGTNWLEKNY